MMRRSSSSIPAGKYGFVTRLFQNRICRFCVVGVINTAVSYIVFISLFGVLPAVLGRATIAQIFAYGAGIATSFTLNKRWTFQTNDLARRRFTRFLAAQALCVALSSASLGLLIDKMGWPPSETWFGVSVVIVFLNYGLQSAWVFRK